MAFDFKRAAAAQLGGKALGVHPAFMGADPVSVYQPGAARQRAVLSQREAPRHFEAYGGKQAIDHVYDAIGLYTDAISSAEYRLEKSDGTKLVRAKRKGTPPDHEVGPQELYGLLDKPNPYVLYDELMALLVIDLLLVGNAYWLKWQTGASGKPLALYRLAPSHVKIVPGALGPKAYEYQPPGSKDKLVIQPEEVIHFRRPNPHSAYYGLGVIQAAGRSMDLEISLTDTVASYYENKADPSLIVQSDRRVPRDVFNKLRAQMRARTAGSKRAGEVLLLEAGLKADTLSASASDALFDKLSAMSRDRVFQKFRVSPMLLGLMDEVSGTNKVSDARREFDNYTLRPFMARLANQISVALLEPWDVRLNIDYRSILPSDEATKVGESVAKIPGVKVREVRSQYAQFGIEESTGDPELDEMVLNKPMGDLGPDGQPVDPSIASGADPNLSSEPGRPPLPGNTTPVGVAKPAGKALSIEEIEAKLAVHALIAKAENKAVSTPAPDNRLPGESRPDDSFAKARQVDIDATQATIAAGLRDATHELERALLDHVEGKALKTSDLAGRIRRSAAWKNFQAAVERVLLEGAKQAAASGVMHSKLSPEEDVDYDALAKSVVHRPTGLRAIVSTLKDRVVGRIKDTRDANGERHDFEAAVRAVLAEWADGQAVTIADSEATEAYNEGTLTAAELSGVSNFFVTEEPDAPDQACQDAHGQVWDLTKARANRKEHPNCRRAFIPLAADALA